MKIFFHASDLDGQCSGAIMSRKFPTADLIAYNYWYDPVRSIDLISPNEEVYFVDITPRPDQLKRVFEITQSVTIIDHHEKAVNEMEKAGISCPGIQVRDGDLGACALVWQWLHKDKEYPVHLPIGIRYIAEYDAWKRTPENIQFQYGIKTFNTLPTNWIWDNIIRDDQKFFDVLMRAGKSISSYITGFYKKLVRSYAIPGKISYLKDGKPVEYTALFLNQGGVDSGIFDHVEEDYDVFIRGTFGKQRRWSISITTRNEDFDLHVIAEDFDGGGHKNACGMVVDDLADFFLPDGGYVDRFRALPKSDNIHE